MGITFSCGDMYIDCDYGTALFGGGKNAYCHKTGKKINELVGCKLWKRQK